MVRHKTAAFTARPGLRHNGKLQPGQKVLINGVGEGWDVRCTSNGEAFIANNLQ